MPGGLSRHCTARHITAPAGRSEGTDARGGSAWCLESARRGLGRCAAGALRNVPLFIIIVIFGEVFESCPIYHAGIQQVSSGLNRSPELHSKPAHSRLSAHLWCVFARF